MNGKTFFKLFLSDLDEKMTSAGKKGQKMTLCNSSRNLCKYERLSFSHAKENIAYT